MPSWGLGNEARFPELIVDLVTYITQVCELKDHYQPR
jgi:hypothetical protein